MPVPATSIEAYHDPAVARKISRQQRQVLRWMSDVGRPVTSGELLGNRVSNLNLWRARLTELANLGAIREVGRRHCHWSGRRAIVWAPASGPWRPRRSRRDYYRELEQLMDQALVGLERSEDLETRALGSTLRLARLRLLSD